MKSFLSFLLGVILTAASLGFFYQSYLVPRGTPLIAIPSPDPSEPSRVIETCTTQRIYGRGYSFCLPLNHTIEQETERGVSQNITLTSSTTWDTITIDHDFSSTAYTDSDSKFGDVTVSYNPEKKTWESTGECNIGKKCNSSFYNKQGLHVFLGRSSWLTYIVPLDTSGIVVFNSSGGGFIQPLEELIKTVRKEKV